MSAAQEGDGSEQQRPAVCLPCSTPRLNTPMQLLAGLEVAGFLFNQQFKPLTRLRAPSFKEGGAAAAAASAAVSAGKVRCGVGGLAWGRGAGPHSNAGGWACRLHRPCSCCTRQRCHSVPG